MKRKLFLSCFLICVFLIGCGSTQPQSNKTSTKSTTQTKKSSVTSVPTEVPTEAPTEVVEEDFDYQSVTMKKVESTMIAEVGYDNAEILLVRFRSNGALYAYYDFPKEEYNALMSADSKGSFFNQNIRDKYSYEKLEASGYVEPMYNEVSKSEASYSLNTNSGKFHKLSCRYADAENAVYVSDSKEELEEKGYVPCKVCKP